ncbi:MULTISPECIES: class F sortase [Thermomonospora]|uniref:Class F sortase n=1 Tax=Thermomonospora cellulosilytica TaxID=1411118 RepID=A0A7W3R9R5_9ACTN|nr:MULTISPECIES: class F sortase [Thermomonospora]MBA9004605.1 hypothetical protein [Thermomonospora cellulosilytica]
MRPGRRAVHGAAVALAAALATGCGGAEPAAAPPPRSVPTWNGSAGPAAPLPVRLTYAGPMRRSVPVSIRIPKLGVSAPVSQLGLRPDGRVEEPPLSRPNLAGWYKEGPSPGEAGPSVLLGHVDANRRPAVFHRLTELYPGDLVEVTRRDGTVARFAVVQMARVSKSRFPGELIYAEDIDYPALRLVTCGGSFDARTGHYTENVIAFTRLVK